MKLWLSLVAVVVLAIDVTPAVAQQASKADATPDFCQTDKQGKFYNGGKMYCAPVAASNSIVWLAQQGYPQLLDAGESNKQSQIELIRTLASSDYMGTAGRNGTGPRSLTDGVYKYVTERGCKIERLEFRGWGSVRRQFSPTKEAITLDWIAKAIAHPRGVAFTNIGWYTYDKKRDTYIRHGGHWMTITGAGVNARGKRDNSVVHLHDPASRSGRSKTTHYSRLLPLENGKLTGPKRGLPTTAAGVLEVRDGIVIKKVVEGERTRPLVDGVAILVLGE